MEPRLTSVSVLEAHPADVESWLLLVAEVEPLFGRMPNFAQVLLKNIERRCALVVHDEDGAVAGGLLLSGEEHEGSVTWLAVRGECRGQGIGESLVREAIRRLAESCIVSVVTFGEDMPAGQAARRLYERLGFTARELVADAPDGGSRQRFTRVSGICSRLDERTV
jgi:ribosomal protein S18 acetylase RimI-like enzyme